MEIIRESYKSEVTGSEALEEKVRLKKSNEISGNWGTLLLPIEADNSINFQKLEEEIELLIGFGVDGIYSNGTAGEFFNQTENEFDKISLLLAEKCHASGTPFQIGCSHTDPLMCLSRVSRAAQLKPIAIQVILPDWASCEICEAISFVEKVASVREDAGIVIYNPMNARKVLTPDELLEIKYQVPEVEGCKVAWPDDAPIRRLADARELSVFVPGHRLATGFTLGANGSYSNVACLNPSAAQRWYNQMKSLIYDALELESRIQFFLNRFIVPYLNEGKYSNTAVDKFLAAVGGWSSISPRIRWPYRWIPESDIELVRSNCKKILPEFFI